MCNNFIFKKFFIIKYILKMNISSYKISFIKSAVVLPFLYSYYKYNTTIVKKTMWQLPEENEDDFEGMSNFKLDEEELDPEYAKIMNDTQIDEETKREVRRERSRERVQPLPFSKIHQTVKAGIDDEKWNGIRLGLGWNPTQMYKMEWTLILDKLKASLANYKISAMAMIPGILNINFR
jgi:hypothetical protein